LVRNVDSCDRRIHSNQSPFDRAVSHVPHRIFPFS
jgi:hypothetical protein